MSAVSEKTVMLVCGTILALSAIIGIAIYYISDRSLMAQNIESAITKGIDPISVRCSYAHSQDIICIAFAASSPSHGAVSTTKK